MNLQYLTGLWNGAPSEDSFLHYTEVEIFQSSSSKLHLRILGRQYDPYPEPELEWQSSHTFTCKLPHDVLAAGTMLKGQFNRQMDTLDIEFSASIFSIENYSVKLWRNDPDCAKYRHAAEDLNYEYRVPISNDPKYFTPGDAANHGLDTKNILSMIKRLLTLNPGTGTQINAQVDGIMILRDNKLILEEYFWGFSPSDYHQISSCTKSVTSLLFGIAWDQGLIDLEEPIVDIFPEIPSTTWGDSELIRLKHVLSMTTGTVFEDGLDEEMLRAENIAAYVLASKRTSQPGTTYVYDNSLPMLAGLILERKTKRSVASFAAEYLFEPMDIQTARWEYMEKQKSIDGSPFAMTAGAMCLRMRDFIKIGQLLLDEGLYAGKRVVSKAWLDLSAGRQHSALGQYPYGFYWHLNTPQQPEHFHGFEGVLAIGQGEQICAVIPKLNMVVAWMSSTWVNHFGYRVGVKVIDEEFISKINPQASEEQK